MAARRSKPHGLSRRPYGKRNLRMFEGDEPLHMALVPAEAAQHVRTFLKEGDFQRAAEMVGWCESLGFRRESRWMREAVKTASEIEMNLTLGNFTEAGRLLRKLKMSRIVPKNHALPTNPIPAIETRIAAAEARARKK